MKFFVYLFRWRKGGHLCMYIYRLLTKYREICPPAVVVRQGPSLREPRVRTTTKGGHISRYLVNNLFGWIAKQFRLMDWWCPSVCLSVRLSTIWLTSAFKFVLGRINQYRLDTLHGNRPWWDLLNCDLFLWPWPSLFSSPEPKAQVTYCHRAPSVVRPSVVVRPSSSVNFSHFRLLLQNR